MAQQNGKNDHQKFEILNQKDKEMTTFIENFDKTRNKELQNLVDYENMIVEALEK